MFEKPGIPSASALEWSFSLSQHNATSLPLTSLDAGLLRQIAAKVDDDNIDVNDATVLRGIADTIDAVIEAAEQSDCRETHAGCGGSFTIDPKCDRCAQAKSACTVNTALVWRDLGNGDTYDAMTAHRLHHERQTEG